MSNNEAWRNARAMYQNDACAQALGIDIVEMDDGVAVLTMTVTPLMLLSLIHISEPTRQCCTSRMPSSA